jgi:hypothetical protein
MNNNLFTCLVSVFLGSRVVLAQETNHVLEAEALYIRDVLSRPEPFFERYGSYVFDAAYRNTMHDLLMKRFPDPFKPGIDKIDSVGEDIFADSFADGGKEFGEDTATYYFLKSGLEGLMNRTGEILGVGLGKFTRVFVGNTINGTAEESLDPSSLTFQSSKSDWLEKMKEDGNISYGLRPASSPYIFVSTHVRWKKKELMYINLRCYYRKFETFQSRVLVSVPLADGWSFDTGFVYTPHPDNEKLGTVSVGVVRLEKEISDSGFFFIGGELSRNHSILTGLSFKW